jgi:hypothetical protein
MILKPNTMVHPLMSVKPISTIRSRSAERFTTFSKKESTGVILFAVPPQAKKERKGLLL